MLGMGGNGICKLQGLHKIDLSKEIEDFLAGVDIRNLIGLMSILSSPRLADNLVVRPTKFPEPMFVQTDFGPSVENYDVRVPLQQLAWAPHGNLMRPYSLRLFSIRDACLDFDLDHSVFREVVVSVRGPLSSLARNLGFTGRAKAVRATTVTQHSEATVSASPAVAAVDPPITSA
jgi:hypothetical protein